MLEDDLFVWLGGGELFFCLLLFFSFTLYVFDIVSILVPC